MDYVIKQDVIGTSAALVLDAAEFDRGLVLAPTGEVMFVGFDDTNMARLDQGIYLSSDTPGRSTSFVLPAGKELWAKTSSGTYELNTIASVAP